MKIRAAWLALLLASAPWFVALAAAAPEQVQTCIACHGPNGISQQPLTPSLAGQPEGFLQWQMVFFRGGTRKSPLMQPIAAAWTDDDIRALSAYFTALPPPQRDAGAAVDTAMYAVGQKLAQVNHCAACHKEDFTGTQATARTANQREDYLLKALRDFKSGQRTGGGVAAMADAVYRLGDDEMRALAHFMAHLH